jgi:pimeloyl-ACP methyl ester carboxylesterase
VVSAMWLHRSTLGSGPRVVFVHGSMTTSEQTWQRQAVLAERWKLVVVDRRGYEPNPPAESSDFEVDGVDLAELLQPGDHVVGHSYGALGALFAVASRPEVVRSLTVIEPPTLSLVRGDPTVEETIAAHSESLRDVDDPREFYVAFATRIGAPTAEVPDRLPVPLERLVRLLMHERPPWEASLPIDALQGSSFPKLVVSGGWDPGQEATCDALAARLGPLTERAVISGRGHVVQRIGAPFNETLEHFLTSASWAHTQFT